MPVDYLFRYLSWFLFIIIFLIVGLKAIRDPRRETIDIALFFSVPVLTILLSFVLLINLFSPSVILIALLTSLLLSMSYMLLRLVDDFSEVPNWFMHSSEVTLGLLILGAWVLSQPQPLWLSILMLLYLGYLLIYASLAFIRESQISNGVTRRRMQAAAAGTFFIVLIFLFASLNLVTSRLMSLWDSLATFSGLAAGICYFIGFAPPTWLKRAWQEPELYTFLGHSARIAYLPNTNSILRELEQGATTSLGASFARIGLWNENTQALHFLDNEQPYHIGSECTDPAAQAFRTQQPIFSANFIQEYPVYREMSERYRITTVLSAPISAGDHRLGVLMVCAARRSIFAEDDLAVIKLLADQSAIILASRDLVEKVSRVQMLEESARIKEDFLSAAAHDIKTPLTTLIAKTQLMERQAIRNPAAPADLAGLQLLVREGKRLKRLVQELMDAIQREHYQFVGERTLVDLPVLVQDICVQQCTEIHPFHIEYTESIVGVYDQLRITQLLENLIENAIKYSPHGGPIRVKIWREEERVQLSITDEGIGIPSEDLPRVFERFFRGTNVNDRHFAGMGLGLYICQSIVAQHGGKIWVSSQMNKGSTFQIELPLKSILEATNV